MVLPPCSESEASESEAFESEASESEASESEADGSKPQGLSATRDCARLEVFLRWRQIPHRPREAVTVNGRASTVRIKETGLPRID